MLHYADTLNSLLNKTVCLSATSSRPVRGMLSNMKPVGEAKKVGDHFSNQQRMGFTAKVPNNISQQFTGFWVLTLQGSGIYSRNYAEKHLM